MTNVLKANKDKAIEILSSAFDSNPSVNIVIKNDSKRKERIRHLSEYAYKMAVSREGVYLSSDQKGVAIFYRFNYKKETISDYINQLKLVFNSIGLDRALSIVKRDNYIKSRRPKSGDYLYFWFLGVAKNDRGKGSALELKELLFKESKEKNLPIYLETSVPKNKRVYERYGFVTYHSWKQNDQDPELWFMMREPS